MTDEKTGFAKLNKLPEPKPVSGYSNLSRARLEESLDNSQKRVTQFLARQHADALKIEGLVSRLNKCEPMARDFEILLDAVKENEIVRGAWERLMMTFRMTGYDKK